MTFYPSHLIDAHINITPIHLAILSYFRYTYKTLYHCTPPSMTYTPVHYPIYHHHHLTPHHPLTSSVSNIQLINIIVE